MTITKRQAIGQISIDEFGNISIRTDTIIEEDGLELSRSFHREALMPGADVSAKGELVAAVVGLVWTPEVTAAAAERKQAALARMVDAARK